MADEEDLKLLMSGATDLSKCDFRGADLSGMDLSQRDFSNCLFENAICTRTRFDGSDFRGARLMKMKADHASFNECNFHGVQFAFINLTGASLRSVNGAGASFLHAKLEGADLSGSNFGDANLDADTVLTNAVADKATNFLRLKLMRGISRDPLFKEYTYDKGMLVRRTVPLDGDDVSTGTTSLAASEYQASAEPFQAPASDRMVRFDHNAEAYKEVSAKLDAVLEILRGSNEDIQNAEEISESVSFARSLWGRLEIPYMTAKIGIIMALEDAIALAKKEALAVALTAARAAVVDYLGRFLR